MTTRRRFVVPALLAGTAAALLASSAAAGSPAGPGPRIAAATATARSGTNACAAIRPFYWEIGDPSL